VSPYDVVIREKEEVEPAPEVVHSWAPRREQRTKPITTSTALREFAKSFATWVILLVLSVDVLALPVEPLLLLSRHAPLRAAIATTFAAVGYSTIFAMAAALPIATVYALVRLIGRMGRPWSLTWPIPLVALAWLVIVYLAPHPFVDLRVSAEARAILFGALSALLVVATAVTRLTDFRWRTASGVLLGVAMLGVSLSLPPTVHREPRDVVWVCLVVCAAAVLYPVRRSMKAYTYERVGVLFAATCASSVVFGLLAKPLSPNWRVYGRDYGRFAERLGRISRTLIDFDGDGFSPVLGGLDCDDFDPARSPIAGERVDGKDRNCNGQTRPEAPTLAQRGLAAAAGEPDARPDEIERVVLISVDCFRSDILTPGVTPNLATLATQGVTFTKLYAGGARTTTSLPLVMRGAYTRPPVASLLAGEGVSSTAIFAYRHSTLERNVFEGFGSVVRPEQNDRRFRATEVTDAALADLRDPANARRHFLWVHYFDAHGPRSSHVLPPEVPRFGPIPGEDEDSSLYLSELAYDDREIGRLLEGIRETGDSSRTLIAVTGDHGEGFGAHAEYEHGQSPFDEIIHVPGILVAPGIVAGRYEHVVSHRDIAATVLGAFGLVAKNPTIEDFGRSWLRLRASPDAPLHDFVITYSTSNHVQQWSDAPMVVRTDDHAKLAVSYLEGIQRLYHLEAADREYREVSTVFPEEAARDRSQLEGYRDVDHQAP
jgi:arylsulfatase A-like enzyme